MGVEKMAFLTRSVETTLRDAIVEIHIQTSKDARNPDETSEYVATWLGPPLDLTLSALLWDYPDTKRRHE